MKVKISEIKVGSRYRKEFGDMEALEASLVRHGQLQPIILDAELNLIAGERRLRAAMHIGWVEIEALHRADLDEIQKKEIEIEENLRRKEFTWPEEVLALEDLYKLRRARYGSRTQGDSRDLGYGLKEASVETDKSVGMLHYDLELAGALHQIPELAYEKTKSAAYKRWRRERDKQLRTEVASRQSGKSFLEQLEEGGGGEGAGDQREESAEPALASADSDASSPSSSSKIRKAGFKGHGLIYNADARTVLRSLPSSIVDCIITDPPYALGLFREGQTTSGRRLAENQGGLYDDDPSHVLDMLDNVFRECARILKPTGHGYVFFHHNLYEDIYQLLRNHFGHEAVEQVPCIWIKNTPGIGDPNVRWCPGYESFFFVSRGRPLVKPQAFNYLQYNTIPPTQKSHPTEKPTALLRHIIEASCVKGEVILDPFAGSGSTLVAAVELGCKFYGIELDESYYRKIVDRVALKIGELEDKPIEAQVTEAANG